MVITVLERDIYTTSGSEYKPCGLSGMFTNLMPGRYHCGGPAFSPVLRVRALAIIGDLRAEFSDTTRFDNE